MLLFFSVSLNRPKHHSCDSNRTTISVPMISTIALTFLFSSSDLLFFSLICVFYLSDQQIRSRSAHLRKRNISRQNAKTQNSSEKTKRTTQHLSSTSSSSFSYFSSSFLKVEQWAKGDVKHQNTELRITSPNSSKKQKKKKQLVRNEKVYSSSSKLNWRFACSIVNYVVWLWSILKR
jgi:hypothetical protein